MPWKHLDSAGGPTLWTPPRAARAAPQAPALYAFFREGRLLYIGITSQLSTRLGHHHLLSAGWGQRVDEIRWRPWRRSQAEEARCEARLLQRLRPPLCHPSASRYSAYALGSRSSQDA